MSWALIGLVACSEGGPSPAEENIRDAAVDARVRVDARSDDDDARAGEDARTPGDASAPAKDADADLADEPDAAPGPVVSPGDPGKGDFSFEIDSARGVRAISPLIYGSNDTEHVREDGVSVIRIGGNRYTAFNWENNASNAGSDYMFQNDGFLSASNTPGQVVSDAVGKALAGKAATIVTVPIVDYVSADKLGNGDVRNTGTSYLSTRFVTNHEAKGAPFANVPDQNDKAVYQDEFAAWLKKTQPNAQILFSLDNEPDLWSSTHAEIHPKPVTYAELWDRNYRYAKALKAVWPEAKVLGVVSYGFNGYVTLQNASDANKRDFLEWYLDQAQAKDQADGARVIDYLDLHWYPEARGDDQRIIDPGATSSGAIAAREQAPRSLWDPSYDETSWIHDFLDGPIDLLHSVQGKIAAHYPGTALAFTEWNYGGGNHISGAIAVADVLGIFGREGVALATYWPLGQDESYARAGLRAYRNFDGQGGAFGDTAVSAQASDPVNASVYASIDSRDPARMVLLAINKASSKKTAAIRISHTTSYRSLDVYQLSGAANLSKAASVAASASNAFLCELPGQSVSVLVPRGSD